MLKTSTSKEKSQNSIYNFPAELPSGKGLTFVWNIQILAKRNKSAVKFWKLVLKHFWTSTHHSQRPILKVRQEAEVWIFRSITRVQRCRSKLNFKLIFWPLKSVTPWPHSRHSEGQRRHINTTERRLIPSGQNSSMQESGSLYYPHSHSLWDSREKQDTSGLHTQTTKYPR